MSLLSAILPGDVLGVKFAKLQRQFRREADNAGIIYNIGGYLQDIRPTDTEGIKWAKLGAWAELNANNAGGGGVPAGPITTSGLTMNTARILARTTAGSGAIEERAIGAGLTLAVGGLSVAAAQTTISSITAPTNTALTLATLDNNKDINLTPHGTGVARIPNAGALFPGSIAGISFNNDGSADGVALRNGHGDGLGWLFYGGISGLFTTGSAADWSLGIDIRPVSQIWLKDAAGAIHVGADAGVDGTITAASTVTVKKGIITNIA